jgi:type II secretory ATPase GspE/PulE/Tfp pilus assembly ATPase PilB-like protein
MGSEPFMAASALSLVAAQRLVRRNCPHCLEPYTPAKETLMALGLPAEAAGEGAPVYRRGTGCASCRNRGYAGRVAVIEKMVMTSGLRELVANRRPAAELRTLAVAEGMQSLQQAGLKKAEDGLTTIEEVLRVCIGD